MDILTAISLIIGVLGLLATLAGTYLAYISFINPLIRFRKYLKKQNDWEKFIGTEAHISIYRHKKYPNFQIVIDWDRPIVENFHEEWINDALYPDKTNNDSHSVRLEVSSMLLDQELFVSLDGHRWFVPVPKIERINGKRNLYYDPQQIQLANIIGRYHFLEKNIIDFAKSQKIPITIKN